MNTPTDTSATDTEAARVHRSLVELTQAGREDEALTLIADDVIDHRGGALGDVHGLTAWREKWDHMHDGLTGASVTIEQNVAAGDISVNRYTIRATHDATGLSYEVNGIDMVRVRNGKLTEHWALMDSSAVRHQLGLDQA